jgi:hypothetical protein
VSGVMRTQAEGIAVPEKPRPQVWDPDQIDNWRRYTKLRTQLYPYIDAADAFYHRQGVPIMRHLVLRWPGDEQAVAREDEFLFGPDLLAAPVLEPETTERELYLPSGRWVEFWDAIAYKERSGDLELGKARLVRGKRSRTVSADADELPLMVRAGALLPLLPADVDTLADRYAGGRAASRGSGKGGQVSLSDRKRRLEVLAFPRGRSASQAYGNAKLISRERGRKWRLEVKGKQRRGYKIDASLATLRNPFTPECVTVKGKPLSGKAWSYSKRERLVRIKLRARRAAIVARARCGL